MGGVSGRPSSPRPNASRGACGVLRIGVALDNPDARRLYERAGYVATGEVEEYDYTYVDDDGRQVTAQEASAYLAKDLRGGA